MRKEVPKSVDGNSNRVLLLYRLSQLVKIGREFGGSMDTDKSQAVICYFLEKEWKAEQLWESIGIAADVQIEPVSTVLGPVTDRTVEAMMEFISNHIGAPSDAVFFFTQGTSPLLQIQKGREERQRVVRTAVSSEEIY